MIDPFGHRWMISGPTAAVPGVGAPRPGQVSYASLWVGDVERAATFYGSVLGWRYAPGSAPHGRLVEGVHPPLGLWGGQAHATMFLCFATDDIAAALQRVRARGGQAEEPRREPWGLVADCVDDQGMAFALSETDVGDPASTTSPGHGELTYVTIGVPDTARAQAFFASVLGWRFSPGHSPGGWNVEGVTPMAGVHGGNEVPVVVPMFAVDDVAAAVARVRASGGTASDPEQMPYGITADCTDDQGGRFWLGQL